MANRRNRFGMSRRSFLGTAAAGVGAAAMGIGGVSKAKTPPQSNGAVVTVCGEAFSIPIFVNAYDKKSGLIGVAVGANPDIPIDPFTYHSYLGDSFTEVNLPNDLGIYDIPGLADISVWKGREVPLLVYGNITAREVLFAAFATTVWHYILEDPDTALQQALFHLRDGTMQLYNIDLEDPLNPSPPNLPAPLLDYDVEVPLAIPDPYDPETWLYLPHFLVAKSPPGEGAKMRVTLTAVKNGFASANANGPVERVGWNGSTFVSQGFASALMVFVGVTHTIPNPITGGETIDVLKEKTIHVKIY